MAYFAHSIICPLGALIENTKRIEDYAVFTIPRVLEGFYDFFLRLRLIKPLSYSYEILFSIAISLLLFLRNYYEDLIPSTYLKTLNFIFGKKPQKRIKSNSNLEIDNRTTNEITFK